MDVDGIDANEREMNGRNAQRGRRGGGGGL